MKHPNLTKRTKRSARDLIRLVERLPAGETYRVIGRQPLRAGTSVAANQRAASRARSPADCVPRLGVVEEETDAGADWLGRWVDDAKGPVPAADPLLPEAEEWTAMVVSPIHTAGNRHDR